VIVIGPVEYVVVELAGGGLRTEVVPALADLVEAHAIRLLDVVFVSKDGNGDVSLLELDALDGPASARLARCADLDGEVGGLLRDEDVIIAAEVLEPNSSAAVVVWDRRWAARAAEAVRRAGGRVVTGERVLQRPGAQRRPRARARAAASSRELTSSLR
jgi:Family of unknown function (DUF6325)